MFRIGDSYDAGCAASDRAFDFECPADSLNHVSREEDAKPHSLPDFFGREKGLADPSQSLFVHALPAINDSEEPGILLPLDMQRDFGRWLGSIKGVLDEIPYSLAKSLKRDSNGFGFHRRFNDDFDTFWLTERLQDHRH
jgi:hypothetical protein